MTAASELTIRDALAAEDLPVRELTLRSYSEYATVMAPAAWAGLEQALLSALESSDPVQRIVAELDGRLVGSVRLYSASVNAYGGEVDRLTWPEVRLLAVAPEGRGLGIAAALMKECVRRAREAGATELGVHTSDSMRVARRMYERMGFVRAPEHDFRPPGAELVMAYRLELMEGER